MEQFVCLGLQALWLGPLPVGVNSNLPSESILGCPIIDDRYGPGNNKSVYESKTGRMRRGVLLRSFLLTQCSLEYLSRDIQHHSPLEQVKGQERICYGCWTSNFSFKYERHVNMWSKTSRRAALFHPVVSHIQTSYRDLNVSLSEQNAFLSLCSASSSSIVFPKFFLELNVMFYQLFIMWPSSMTTIVSDRKSACLLK